MRKFLRWLWRAITFPIWGLAQVSHFLNSEPEERPIGEVFTDLATNSSARQALWEQVEVLRAHILRALIALALAVIGAFWLAEPLMEYMAQPAGGLASLQAIGPTEGIGVFMKVALMAGLALAMPYIAFEAWLFAAPGLRPREKKIGLFGIPLAGFFFALGMIFTFYVLLPPAIAFLKDFTKITQIWTAREYFALVTNLMVWIGLFFEFPLIIYILTAVGLVQPKFLAEQWRIAIVLIAIIAAAVTPTVDPVNQGLVMAPMILLYFISIGLSYLAYAGRSKLKAEAETSETAPG